MENKWLFCSGKRLCISRETIKSVLHRHAVALCFDSGERSPRAEPHARTVPDPEVEGSERWSGPSGLHPSLPTGHLPFQSLRASFRAEPHSCLQGCPSSAEKGAEKSAGVCGWLMSTYTSWECGFPQQPSRYSLPEVPCREGKRAPCGGLPISCDIPKVSASQRDAVGWAEATLSSAGHLS